MTTKIYAVGALPLQAISNQGASPGLWEHVTDVGVNVYMYTGSVLSECPLAVYYGDNILTEVSDKSSLISGTWAWGDFSTQSTGDTIFLNVGENIEAPAADTVYRSQRIESIPAHTTYDRICVSTRICNNSTTSALVRYTLRNSLDVYQANILPNMRVAAGAMVDDASKLIIPKTYKVSIESSVRDLSVLVSCDEF